MTVKVSDVMRHVRNHFIRDSLCATWHHAGGTLSPTEHFRPGMWIAITGNNAPTGVFQLDEQGGIPGLEDITWTGRVYRLNPPADVIRLCGDIAFEIQFFAVICWIMKLPVRVMKIAPAPMICSACTQCCTRAKHCPPLCAKRRSPFSCASTTRNC